MTDSRRPVREGFFPVAGAQLYFREVGDGAPLVVLHGGPDFNQRYLLPELDQLGQFFRLIYYDQRGRGKSSPGVNAEDVTIESEVDDLDRLRQHLDVNVLALLGHSWGCILAMEYAVRRPNQVAQLVLSNSAPASHRDRALFRSDREAHHPDILARMRAVASTREYLAGDVEAEAQYYRAHFSAALHLPELVDVVVRRLRLDFAPNDIVKARAIEDRLYRQTWDSPDYDLLTDLRQRSARTLLIHGDRDLIPVQCARNIADAIPGAKLVVLKDCGHFAYLERPAEVASAIVSHASGR